MTTPDDQARELWQRALDEHVRAMTPEQRRALIERATEDGGYRPPPNPTRDPAVARKNILASIARKEAKMAAVDHNGVPIPGKLRWGA